MVFRENAPRPPPSPGAPRYPATCARNAAKLERPVEPAYGNDVLNSIKAALSQTPDTIAMLKQALQTGRK